MQTSVFISTVDLEKSKSYYKKLGIKTLNNHPCILTNGKFIIELNNHKFSRNGIKIVKDSWKNEIETLRSEYAYFTIDNGYLVIDNNNTWVYLIEGSDLKISETTRQEASHLGKFMGISLETASFIKSIDFWQKLGFVQVNGGIDQGWIAMANSDGFAVSFMLPNSCPHSFINPSMTFFNSGNNLENIKNIKEAGITIYEEVNEFNNEGIVDNIVLRDPSGYGIFVFND